MKKILFVLLLFSIKSYGQFPVTQTLGSGNTLVYSKGALGSDSGYVYRYSLPDTATANLGFIKNIPGITIRVANSIWIRNTTATQWINLSGTAAGQKFGKFGEDDEGGENRGFDGNGFDFSIFKTKSFLIHSSSLNNGDMRIERTDGTPYVDISVEGLNNTGKIRIDTGFVQFNHTAGIYKFLNVGTNDAATSVYAVDGSGNLVLRTVASIGGGSGVTSVSRTNGYAITASVTNPTTTPNITIGIDSATLFSYGLRRKDSLTGTNLFGYVTKTILKDSLAGFRANNNFFTGYQTFSNGLGVTGNAVNLYAPTFVAADLWIVNDITPPQITSDQNNYNPTGISTANVVRLSSDASRNITGLQGANGSDGRIMILRNIGSFDIVLKDESASSSPQYRFALNADITIAPDQSRMLIYDETRGRWTPVVDLTATGGGGGSTETLTNVGAGNQLVKALSGSNYDVRTLVNGYGITNTTNTNDITQRVDTTVIQKKLKTQESFVIENDSLKSTRYINGADFGMTGDNLAGNPASGTNNTQFIIDAITYAKSIGIYQMYIPPGRYRLSDNSSVDNLITNQLLKNFTIFGAGMFKTVLVTNYNGGMLVADTGTVIRDIGMEGSGSGSFQAGIKISVPGGLYENIYAKNFGGAAALNGGGAFFFNGIAPNKPGTTVNNLYLDSNLCALNFSTRGEYITGTNIHGLGNGVGVCLGGGNVKLSQISFRYGTYGLKMIDGTNNGHGDISQFDFNHNTFNEISDQQLGFSFSNGGFYNGSVYINRSRNIRFSNVDFDGLDSIYFDTDTSIYFDHCLLGYKLDAVTPIPLRYVNSELVNQVATKSLTYSGPRWAFRQVNPVDSVETNGIVYHKNIPTTTGETYGAVITSTGQLKRQVLGAGAGGTLIREIKFEVGETNAPADGENTYTDTRYTYKKINLFREGELQYPGNTTFGYVYTPSSGLFTFYPDLTTGEKIIIQAYDTLQWTIDTLLAPPSGYETESDTYFAAVVSAGGTALTTQEKDDYNDFVVAAKADGTYAKLTHFYPLKGGTAASHAINSISPGTDNLTFSGTWTHSNTSGSDPGGTSSDFANTGVDLTSFSQDNCFLGLYVNENNTGGGYDFGAIVTSGSLASFAIVSRWTDDNFYVYGRSANLFNVANTNAIGFFQVSRTSSANFRYSKNSTVNTQTETSNSNGSGFTVRLGAIPTVAASSKRYGCALMSTSSGLTSGEMTALNTTITTLMTAWGRN